MIAERRAAEAELRAKSGEDAVVKARKNDMLQAFMDATYRNGEKLSDDQITGMLIGVLFAGQHTSSISSTWTVLNLLHHPELMKRALAEQTHVLKHALHTLKPTDVSGVDFDSVGKMSFLHNCMKESLRQYPPLIMLMRKALVPLDVCGGKWRVPENHYVFVCPAVSMNLPKGEHCSFTAPETFDPDRFSDERHEDKVRPGVTSFVAFGGGRHACMGEAFG